MTNRHATALSTKAPADSAAGGRPPALVEPPSVPASPSVPAPLNVPSPPSVPAPPPPELLRVAQRVVWFKAPEDALRDSVHFLCHAMTYGTAADLAVVRSHFSDNALRAVLRRAHPGIFDARSWAYWHVVLGIRPVPPMPVRRLPE